MYYSQILLLISSYALKLLFCFTKDFYWFYAASSTLIKYCLTCSTLRKILFIQKDLYNKNHTSIYAISSSAVVQWMNSSITINAIWVSFLTSIPWSSILTISYLIRGYCLSASIWIMVPSSISSECTPDDSKNLHLVISQFSWSFHRA